MTAASRLRPFAYPALALGLLLLVGLCLEPFEDARHWLGPVYSGFIRLLVDRGLGLSAWFLPLALFHSAWVLLRREEEHFWTSEPPRILFGFLAFFSVHLVLLNTPWLRGDLTGFLPFLAHGLVLNALGHAGNATVATWIFEVLAAFVFVLLTISFLLGVRPAVILSHLGAFVVGALNHQGRLSRGFGNALLAVLVRTGLLTPADKEALKAKGVDVAADGSWIRRVEPRRSFAVDSSEASKVPEFRTGDPSDPAEGRETPFEAEARKDSPPRKAVDDEVPAETVEVDSTENDVYAEAEPAVLQPVPAASAGPSLVIRRLDQSTPDRKEAASSGPDANGQVGEVGPPKGSGQDVDFDLSHLSGGAAPVIASAEEDAWEAPAKGSRKKDPRVINLPGKAARSAVRADAKSLVWSPAATGGTDDEFLKRTATTLEGVLRDFGIEARVVEVATGPVITRFELAIESGIHVSKVVNLSDNIAMSLAAHAVRIVAPIPGKSLIGVEIPNRTRQSVRLRDVVESHAFKDPKNDLPIALGKSILGEPVVADLATTPHLLIAGATGSGKSVCVNALLSSLLVRRSPSELRLILIDPKMVELALYNHIPHLLTPVITDSKQATRALKWVVGEMEARYELLQEIGVRNIKGYNAKAPELGLGTLPYMVVVMDEFADLMTIARKEVEDTVRRLSAMSRAVGIHLVLATQRPSVDVITGVIKNNLPSRIAFQVTSKVDSRTILDQGGADKLLGRGDMLFQSASMPVPERIQGAFLSDEEVQNLAKDLISKGKPEYVDEITAPPPDPEGEEEGEEDEEGIPGARGGRQDPLWDKAWDFAQERGMISTSIIQRRLAIGYNRAARIVEAMEAMGLVAPADGSRPRKVISSGRA